MICTREMAERLKAAGFDLPVCAAFIYAEIKYSTPSNWNDKSFDNDPCTSAPALDEAARWLREKKGLHVPVMPWWNKHNEISWRATVYGIIGGLALFTTNYYDEHDLALTAGIDAALKHLKK